ncbi:hypothetical protein GCM10023189_02620 [Nibrella saemangeumensis]|uniref:histidine kinase n=1 Tax=Nibrella saemangeumensis TaxID=1084526 RepID=A0ABP8MBR8_9BACT
MKGVSIERQSSEVFQDVIDNMPIGLVLYQAIRDAEGRVVDFLYVFANEAYAKITGRPLHRVVGSTLSEVYPPASEQGFLVRLMAVMQSGQPVRFEERLVGSGSDRWIDINLVKQGDGVLFTFQDISETKQLQRKEREQKEQLISVLNGCQIALSLFEPIRNDQGTIIDFRYVTHNEANARLINWTGTEVPRQTMLDLLPGLVACGMFARYVQVAETGVPQRIEQVYQADGIDGVFDISIARQGEGIVVSVVDQTPLRQALNQAESLVGQLKQSNEYLQQFAYVASHDLQEPLRKVKSFGDVLMDQYGDVLGETGADLVKRMQNATTRMQSLVRDLLAYSRLSTGANLMAPVSLDTLLKEVLDDLDLTIRQTRAIIIIEFLPVVTGNRAQLTQLFSNLLSNALKFHKPGQRPDIVIRGQYLIGHIFTDLKPLAAKKRYVQIDVIDNGIGFDEQHSERVFQMFQRLHSVSKYPGTGVGLALCKKITENHGGAIAVRSKAGVGTTFTITLEADAKSFPDLPMA